MRGISSCARVALREEKKWLMPKCATNGTLWVSAIDQRCAVCSLPCVATRSVRLFRQCLPLPIAANQDTNEFPYDLSIMLIQQLKIRHQFQVVGLESAGRIA